jgi:hypothetical protein
MWVVTIDGLSDPAYFRFTRMVVQHRDGSNPKSICQALRLVREELVRQGVEDGCTILKAEFEPDLTILAVNGEAK